MVELEEQIETEEIMNKYKMISNILYLLETKFTKGRIINTWFELESKHKRQIKAIKGKQLFKKYNLEFIRKGFQIIAIPIIKELEHSLLFFQKLKTIFEPLKIDTSINISDGYFIFRYNLEE